MEAFGVYTGEADDEETDDEESDEDDDEDENDVGGGSGGLSVKATDADDAPGDDGEHGSSDGVDDDGDDGPGGGAGGVVHIGGSEAADVSGADGSGSQPSKNVEAAESNRSIEIASARRLLYDEAIRTRDDLMLRHMRKQMREQTLNQKDASTEVGSLLRKRAQEQRAEEAKRRRDAVEEERLAAKDLEETKLIRAKAEQAAAEVRLAALKHIILNRRDAEARKQAEVMERARQRWLQTTYPVLLARRCIDTYRGLSKGAKTGFGKTVCSLLAARTFERQLFITDLWESDKSLTLQWSHTTPFTGGPRRPVRCALPFQELVDKEAPQTRFAHDPVDALLRLFSACVPEARRVFAGACTPLRLLHVNDYVMEKTFVYGIIALSKWLGEERFPHGVYGVWPPEFPADLVPPQPHWSELVHPDIPHSSGDEAVLLDLVPPHLRTGSASASSSHLPD